MSTDFIAALKAEIDQIDADLAADPRVVKLRELRRLLDIYEKSGEPTYHFPPNIGAMRVARQMAAVGSERSRRATSATRLAAIDATRIFLKGKTEPVKTAEIFAHVKGLGIEIGGENPQNNLSAMLYHSNEFQSHKRAGWTWPRNLGESNPNPDQEDDMETTE